MSNPILCALTEEEKAFARYLGLSEEDFQLSRALSAQVESGNNNNLVITPEIAQIVTEGFYEQFDIDTSFYDGVLDTEPLKPLHVNTEPNDLVAVERATFLSSQKTIHDDMGHTTQWYRNNRDWYSMDVQGAQGCTYWLEEEKKIQELESQEDEEVEYELRDEDSEEDPEMEE